MPVLLFGLTAAGCSPVWGLAGERVFWVYLGRHSALCLYILILVSGSSSEAGLRLASTEPEPGMGQDQLSRFQRCNGARRRRCTGRRPERAGRRGDV